MVRRSAASFEQYTLVRGGKRDGWQAAWGKGRGRRRVKLGLPLSAPLKEAEAKFLAWCRARTAALSQDQKLTIFDLFKLYRESRRIEGKNIEKLNSQWKSLAPSFAHLQPADVATEMEVQKEKRTRCHAYAVEREAGGRIVRKKERDKNGEPTGNIIETRVGIIARDTIVSELSLLRTIIHWSFRHGHIKEEPFVWVPLAGDGRKTSLTESEMEALIISLFHAPFHVRLFLIIAMSTGARKEAILELEWDRVDFEYNTVDFNRKAARSILDTSHIKGRAIVDMSVELRETLLEAHEWRPKNCSHVIEWRGKRIIDPREAIKTVFRRAGLDRRYLGPHALRHTIATWAIAKGIEPQLVQQLLGHRNLETTMTSYVQHKVGSLTKAAGVITGLLQLQDAKSVGRRDKSQPAGF